MAPRRAPRWLAALALLASLARAFPTSGCAGSVGFLASAIADYEPALPYCTKICGPDFPSITTPKPTITLLTNTTVTATSARTRTSYAWPSITSAEISTATRDGTSTVTSTAIVVKTRASTVLSYNTETIVRPSTFTSVIPKYDTSHVTSTELHVHTIPHLNISTSISVTTITTSTTETSSATAQTTLISTLVPVFTSTSVRTSMTTSIVYTATEYSDCERMAGASSSHALPVTGAARPTASSSSSIDKHASSVLNELTLRSPDAIIKQVCTCLQVLNASPTSTATTIQTVTATSIAMETESTTFTPVVTSSVTGTAYGSFISSKTVPKTTTVYAEITTTLTSTIYTLRFSTAAVTNVTKPVTVIDTVTIPRTTVYTSTRNTTTYLYEGQTSVEGWIIDRTTTLVSVTTITRPSTTTVTSTKTATQILHTALPIHGASCSDPDSGFGSGSGTCSEDCYCDPRPFGPPSVCNMLSSTNMCGMRCKTDGECPRGYACAGGDRVLGICGYQACVPVSGCSSSWDPTEERKRQGNEVLNEARVEEAEEEADAGTIEEADE